MRRKRNKGSEREEGTGGGRGEDFPRENGIFYTRQESAENLFCKSPAFLNNVLIVVFYDAVIAGVILVLIVSAVIILIARVANFFVDCITN